MRLTPGRLGRGAGHVRHMPARLGRRAGRLAHAAGRSRQVAARCAGTFGRGVGGTVTEALSRRVPTCAEIVAPPPKALVVSVGCGGPSFRHEGCKTGKHEPSPRQARRRVRPLVAARCLRRSRRALPRGVVQPEPLSDGHSHRAPHLVAARSAHRIACAHAAPRSVGVERSRCRPRLPRPLHGARPRRTLRVVVQRRHPARQRRERVRVPAGPARGRSRRVWPARVPVSASART
jgi:hypothetical protein